MKPQVMLYYLFKLAVLVAVWIIGFYVWSFGFDISAISASVSSVAQSITASTAPQTDPNGQSAGADGSSTGSDGQDADQQMAASAAGVPTINIPAEGAETGIVTISGTGQPGTQIEVTANGDVVGTATVGEDGQWTVEANLAEPGDYQLSGRALDTSGAVLAESAPATLRVNAAAQKIMPTINLPGDLVEVGQVSLTGTGQPGGKTAVVVNGQMVGIVDVADDGTWAYNADFSEPGDYQLAVRSLDENSVVLAESEPVLMQVNSGAGAANVPASTGTAPTFDLPAGDIQAGEVTLSGTGQPGSQVEVVVNGQVVGTTTVGEDGRWTYTAELAEPGDYQLALRALDDSGSVQAESEPVGVNVIPRRPVAPTINQPEGNTAGVVVLSGTGEPNSTIELLVDGEVIGTTTANGSGVWRLRPVIAEPGDYELTARTLSGEGQEPVVSEPVRLALTAPQPTPTPTPLPPDATPEPGSDQEYIVQAEDWLSKIADKFYGNPQAYPAIFDATNEKAAEDDSYLVIEDPNLIYVGQKLWIPAIDTISIP